MSASKKWGSSGAAGGNAGQGGPDEPDTLGPVGSAGFAEASPRRTPEVPEAGTSPPLSITVSVTLPFGSMAGQSARKRAAEAARLGATLGTALREAFAGSPIMEPIDAVAAFVRTRCVREPGGVERASALLAAYGEWAAGTGGPRLGERSFAIALKGLGLHRHRASVVYYKGVRLVAGGAHARDAR